VVGLDGGNGETFADYSQWESSRIESPTQKSPDKQPRPPTPDDGPKRKLAYLEQREWDAMEEKILEAEHELAAWHREMQESGPDAKRLTEAYERMQQAQKVVEKLYARWAELEAKVAK
jgi:ATP-binding cassette subfamily F protein uup